MRLPFTRFIVWYIDPCGSGPQYNMEMKDGSTICVFQKGRATRYTRAEAKARVPVYDGSGGLKKRTGIKRVFW